MSLSSDDLLRLQKEAVNLITVVAEGARMGKGMTSIGHFDQVEAAILESGREAEAAAIFARVGNDQLLAGVAIGFLLTIIDEVAGDPAITDQALQQVRQRLEQKQSPFEE